MTGEQPTLRTQRLTLRPFGLADAEVVQRLAGNRAIADTTMHIPHPYPEGVAEIWIETHAPGFVDGSQVTYAMVALADSTLLGAVGLAIDREHAKGELGYWVGESYWGRGYATEASRALMDYGFATLNLHRIQARHLVRNPASGRVMQKLGMQSEGIHRHAIRRWGVFEDVAIYAILDCDWPAAPVAG